MENQNEETQKPIAEAVKSAKAEEKEEDIKEKHEKVSQNLENIYASRLKEKAAELEAIEKNIDQKIADFKDFVEKTTISGKGMAIIEKTEDQKRKEKSDQRVKDLMASIGR